MLLFISVTLLEGGLVDSMCWHLEMHHGACVINVEILCMFSVDLILNLGYHKSCVREKYFVLFKKNDIG